MPAAEENNQKSSYSADRTHRQVTRNGETSDRERDMPHDRTNKTSQLLDQSIDGYQGSVVTNIQSICTGVKMGDDGIWYASSIPTVSYPTDGNANCLAIESNSFWFKHRNNCILEVVKLYPPKDNGAIFDIGGGNGFVSLALATYGFDVVLLEPGHEGAANAKRRGLQHVICATTDTANIKPQSVSAVGLFDVVEHIDEDLSFLKSTRVFMKKDARLYITVPAYSFLWSAEDISAGHFRRYTLSSICKLIRAAGFEIEFSSYIFRFLPLPIALFRALPYRIGASSLGRSDAIAAREHTAPQGLATRIIDFALRAEIKNLNKNKAMMFGGSCLVVARKN